MPVSQINKHIAEFSGRPVGLTAALSAYADRLEENGFPVIFDLRHLALLTGISAPTLAGMVKSSDRFYRKFAIPKRRGGERTISAPYPSLKKVQRWIKDHILEHIPVSHVAYAYKKGRSVKDNAGVHLTAESIYKLDIVDFFGSIKPERVIQIFINCGYTTKLSYCLAQLCILDKQLPQGAPTSAVISNIVAKRLDRRLIGLCDDFHVTYSRYSDDLTFSGPKISDKLQVNIKAIMMEEGFRANNDKEVYVRGYSKKKVITGVAISMQQLRVPRSYRRATKLEVYKFVKYDFMTYPEKGIFDPYYPERLIGKLNYWIFIENNNQEPRKLLQDVLEKKKQLLTGFALDIQRLGGSQE